MRVLSTALLLGVVASPVAAEEAARHPIIGDKTPNTLLSKDILDLPVGERDAWMHGAITMMVQTTAVQETGAARCVMDWYFSADETHTFIIETMSTYPTERASSVMFALAGAACEDF